MKHVKINLSKSPFYSVRVLLRGSFLSRLSFRFLIANNIQETLWGLFHFQRIWEKGGEVEIGI